jgi:hypothetical protein
MSRSFSDSTTPCNAFGRILEPVRTAGKIANFMKLALMNAVLVIFLDIDQCAVMGEDTNDILRALLTIFGDMEPSERKQKLMGVARLLVNKWMVRAVKAIMERVGNVHIVFYTQKANTLTQMRHAGVELPSIAGDTIYFHEGTPEQGFGFVGAQSAVPTERIEREFNRLGLVACGVAEMLGLTYTPGLIVTEGKKDVEKMATLLGVDPAKVYLFDDKGEKHIGLLGAAPYAKEHIIPTQPFNFKTVCEEQARLLREMLQTEFSVKGIKEKYPELYKQIQGDPTWPVHNRCISKEEDWVVSYPGDEAAMGPWAIDRIVDRFAPQEDGRSLTEPRPVRFDGDETAERAEALRIWESLDPVSKIRLGAEVLFTSPIVNPRPGMWVALLDPITEGRHTRFSDFAESCLLLKSGGHWWVSTRNGGIQRVREEALRSIDEGRKRKRAD